MSTPKRSDSMKVSRGTWSTVVAPFFTATVKSTSVLSPTSSTPITRIGLLPIPASGEASSAISPGPWRRAAIAPFSRVGMDPERP